MAGGFEKTEVQFGLEGGLYAYYLAPQAAVTMCVVISTGVHQTGSMYDRFASRLVSEGYAVFAYDHRGFGRSESYAGKKRSDAVAFAADGECSLAGDLRDAVVKAKEFFPGATIVVFGHSLGGLCCGVLATSDLEPKPDAFILSNASLWPEEAMGKYSEWKALAEKDPDAIAFPYKPETGSSNQAFLDFWDSPDIKQYVDEGRPMKASYLVSVCDGLKGMNANLSKWNKPALFLRGGEDVARHEMGAAANLLNGASINAKLTILGYPGKFHDIIFEEGMDMDKGKNSVVDDILWWLSRSPAF